MLKNSTTRSDCQAETQGHEICSRKRFIPGMESAGLSRFIFCKQSFCCSMVAIGFAAYRNHAATESNICELPKAVRSQVGRRTEYRRAQIRSRLCGRRLHVL